MKIVFWNGKLHIMQILIEVIIRYQVYVNDEYMRILVRFKAS